MKDNIMHHISDYYGTRHELVLNLMDRLNDQQIMWRPNNTTPSIGFHVWHLARWADYLYEMISNDDYQIWEKENLSVRWGFSGADLGFAETGLGMDDNDLASLIFPQKEVLLDYARRVFSKADQTVSALSDDQFHCRVKDQHNTEWKELTNGDAILNWLVHDSRHLGMIECMLGVQGLKGTATR